MCDFPLEKLHVADGLLLASPHGTNGSHGSHGSHGTQHTHAHTHARTHTHTHLAPTPIHMRAVHRVNGPREHDRFRVGIKKKNHIYEVPPGTFAPNCLFKTRPPSPPLFKVENAAASAASASTTMVLFLSRTDHSWFAAQH